MIEIHAPSTLFIKEIATRLAILDIPIVYKLPDPSVMEPFILIGAYNGTDDRSAKTDNIIEDGTLNIDIYVSGNDRTAAEDMRFEALKLIGRRKGISSTVMPDDSIGRDTYHIPIRISEIIT